MVTVLLVCISILLGAPCVLQPNLPTSSFYREQKPWRGHSISGWLGQELKCIFLQSQCCLLPHHVSCLLSFFSRVGLFVTLWTVTQQASLSMQFSRQECQNGWPFPSLGDLPDSGIEPASPALQADSLLSEPPRKPYVSVGANFSLFVSILQSLLNYSSSENP